MFDSSQCLRIKLTEIDSKLFFFYYLCTINLIFPFFCIIDIIKRRHGFIFNNVRYSIDSFYSLLDHSFTLQICIKKLMVLIIF